MNQQFPALRMFSFQNGRPPTDSLMPHHQLSGDQTKDLDKDQRQVYCALSWCKAQTPTLMTMSKKID